ncbi:hypothetical protein [Segniliparus rugosus]|uniref:Uncharacterized protein n=1 Tax=Segniliparus rugosus (strain ATCC BAA-974 / DSM 45345 / CCUG 50838 / CIP 108380 / JCM 13579 / CDC 945) TaxID=679197 RepID=E5XV54_SEGRC|nr:hypothetical protein [Segniliparus rugosus]EFV11759.1 hypothetical protein HMPREF9336_03376 [Segniliparus rugosus ATCC BAA-974]
MKFTAQDGDADSVLTVYPDHAEADRRVEGEPVHEERPLPPGLWSTVLDRVQKIDQHGGRLAQPADASRFLVTVKQDGAVVKDYDSRTSVDMDRFIKTEISDPIWALFAR